MKLCRKLSTAPMMDLTDKHCRFFFRLLSPNSLLYTEMIHASAINYGNADKLLSFNKLEHPLALQIGGCDPIELAKATKIASNWKYDEINLNCGCPSERVQRGSFGVVLMQDPIKVKNIVKAMMDSTNIPVTVKHRLGINDNQSFEFVKNFVEVVSSAGCKTFIVHARNALLNGVSPKENRNVPKLNYPYVYKLKKYFPDLEIIINGGLSSAAEITKQLEYVDGVMIGREAYRNPYILKELEKIIFGENKLPTRRKVIEIMRNYIISMYRERIKPKAVTRHLMGLFYAQPNSKLWKRTLNYSSFFNGNVDILSEFLTIFDNE